MNQSMMESWYQQMILDLDKMEKANLSPSRKLSDSLQMVKAFSSKLEDHVQEFPFQNPKEQIEFFKEIKPRFYCHWIYLIESYQLKIHLPVGTPEMKRDFFKQELKVIRRYFDQNAFYYHYYKSGATHLDEFFFINDEQMEGVPMTECYVTDAAMTTSFDLLFAKFIAFEKLEGLILNLMNPKTENDTPPINKKISHPTQINLSVDQLGLITRAADDARLLHGRSFSKICEDLAPHIATPEKQQISSNSLRSNAYLSEDSDKNNVIRTLEKMIDFIKGY